MERLERERPAVGWFEPFHRIETGEGQTPADGRRQFYVGELWGRAPRWSDTPKVKAYVGPLPEGASGVEFFTRVGPDPANPPHRLDWSGTRDGVRNDGDFAKISVMVVKFVTREAQP